MLTCDNISYKNRFSGIGFSLTPGALLAVYGKDATGLVMLLAGRLKPTGGQITFEDAPIAGNKEYKELSLYIPCTSPSLRGGQRPTRQSSSSKLSSTLQDWIASLTMFARNDATVEQHVKRLAKKGGGSPELAEAAMRYWGISDLRNAECSTLSPAIRKRIILTQLLTLHRPIWLLDHPDAELDQEGLGMLDALIANRCNQEGIVVLATQREGFMAPLPALRMGDYS